MRPKAIGKLGLDYGAVKAVRADVIHASAWGFRADGPYGDRPAYDDVIQTMAGIADLTRRQDGEPRLTPTIIADKSSGLMLATALLAALYHRERTGEGQAIEVPMLETVTSLVMVEHLAGATFEPPIAGGPGYNRVLSPFRKPQRTKDGFMTLLPYTDRHWRSFFELAGRPELAGDARFRDAKARSGNIGELYAIMAEMVARRTTAEWLALLGKAEIPCAKVVSLEEILEDPHLTATGFWQSYQHPSEGSLRTTAFPVRFGATPGDALRRPPPQLGADTRAVLADAGIEERDIERLIASGAALAR
jgi:crotonobetainyl-CoA:carnitine CoA-transferase CaiB-like acyl-CoA transferase